LCSPATGVQTGTGSNVPTAAMKPQRILNIAPNAARGFKETGACMHYITVYQVEVKNVN